MLHRNPPRWGIFPSNWVSALIPFAIQTCNNVHQSYQKFVSGLVQHTVVYALPYPVYEPIGAHTSEAMMNAC